MKSSLLKIIQVKTNNQPRSEIIGAGIFFFYFFWVGGPVVHKHNYRLCATLCPIYIMGISVIVLLYEKIQIYGLDNF